MNIVRNNFKRHNAETIFARSKEIAVKGLSLLPERVRVDLPRSFDGLVALMPVDETGNPLGRETVVLSSEKAQVIYDIKLG